ncbi:hypothetical protein ACH5RR_028681, partial [Cinchona calisaya]
QTPHTTPKDRNWARTKCPNHAISAFVESKRLRAAKSHQVLQDSPVSVVPISVLWLIPQLIAPAMGEAFHLPGQASLYSLEFPASLKSTSTAMGRLDDVYWVLVVVGGVNFVYYLVCACLYGYPNNQ